MIKKFIKITIIFIFIGIIFILVSCGKSNIGEIIELNSNNCEDYLEFSYSSDFKWKKVDLNNDSDRRFNGYIYASVKLKNGYTFANDTTIIGVIFRPKYKMNYTNLVLNKNYTVDGTTDNFILDWNVNGLLDFCKDGNLELAVPNWDSSEDTLPVIDKYYGTTISSCKGKIKKL